MRVFISVDIEGIAGVASTAQTVPGGHGYEDARRWMTDEVNAAVAGAREAGATAFLVADGHGNALNLLYDRLPTDVQVVASWPRPLSMMQGVDEGWDHAFMIGYHTGGHHQAGVLAHTFRGMQIASVTINGAPASELTFNAMVAAEYGVGVSLVTGDDPTCAHAAEIIPGVTTAAVKVDCGREAARTLLPQAACALITASAKEALQKSPPTPFSFEAPLSIEITFKHHWNAELLSYLPFITRKSAYGIAFSTQSASEAAAIFKFITSYQPLPPTV
ncbi:MAG: M55 family metallopeptidase [Pseudomonadota bacterium]